jgi:hypothetical protein
MSTTFSTGPAADLPAADTPIPELLGLARRSIDIALAGSGNETRQAAELAGGLCAMVVANIDAPTVGALQ